MLLFVEVVPLGRQEEPPSVRKTRKAEKTNILNSSFHFLSHYRSITPICTPYSQNILVHTMRICTRRNKTGYRKVYPGAARCPREDCCQVVRKPPAATLPFAFVYDESQFPYLDLLRFLVQGLGICHHGLKSEVHRPSQEAPEWAYELLCPFLVFCFMFLVLTQD